ncbi:MAG: hypothetical protein JO332_05180 [Planctomycetaceae bacterium]|nr:hypothetical protein [Planctomycetaceae bacterium]
MLRYDNDVSRASDRDEGEPTERFKALPGLPASGPRPVSFSATGQGKHREGFVVEFQAAAGDRWVGNFAKGLTHFSKALLHPEGQLVIVVSGGQGYAVDPDTRTVADMFGGWIVEAISVPAWNMVVLQSPFDFSAMTRTGHGWTTGRLSVDGFRSVRVSGKTLFGERCEVDDTWTPFEIDLLSGKAKGGPRVLKW